MNHRRQARIRTPHERLPARASRSRSSPTREFAHANHGRVNCEGSSGSNDSCARYVPACEAPRSRTAADAFLDRGRGQAAHRDRDGPDAPRPGVRRTHPVADAAPEHPWIGRLRGPSAGWRRRSGRRRRHPPKYGRERRLGAFPSSISSEPPRPSTSYAQIVAEPCRTIPSREAPSRIVRGERFAPPRRATAHPARRPARQPPRAPRRAPD